MLGTSLSSQGLGQLLLLMPLERFLHSLRRFNQCFLQNWNLRLPLQMSCLAFICKEKGRELTSRVAWPQQGLAPSALGWGFLRASARGHPL